MPRPATDPLFGTDRLLVDGSNLLHAMRRGDVGRQTAGNGSGGEGSDTGATAAPAPAAPAATAIGRLRAAIPPQVGIELVLDGPPDRGLHNARIASGLIVRYGGRRTGDQVLLDLVEDVLRQSGGGGSTDRRRAVDNVLVVTDDRALRAALRTRGVRTAGTSWLLGRLDQRRASSPTTGNRRSPTPPGANGPEGSNEERAGWKPGRGATTKRGNPKRGHRPA